MASACIRRIATATPPHDVHDAFLDYASSMLHDERARNVLRHMAQRSGIEHRYSFVKAEDANTLGLLDGEPLFRAGKFPATSTRMKFFERFAPQLLRCALDRLALTEAERRGIRHVIVTCCTGLFAPGLDFTAIEHLQLDPEVDRTMIGFMGCYAAINGLKMARHLVRSEPENSVLLINLELCTLHFQETQNLEKVLSFLLFADGCAVSLIQSGEEGFVLDGFRAFTIPEARDLIVWRIGDDGFDMELSGKVPSELRKALAPRSAEIDPDKSIDLWAIHPGGRSILDGVEAGLALPPEKLQVSRAVLKQFGNMSSATIMFVLAEMMRTAKPGERGCAMAFGPGLTAETMKFHVA